MAALPRPGRVYGAAGLIDADPDGITAGQARLALGRITMILACKGGLVRDITVGDCLQLLDAMHQAGTGGAGRLLVYRLLHGLGHAGRPRRPRCGRCRTAGQRSVEQLVDRYRHRLPAGPGPARGLPAGTPARRWTTSPCASSPGTLVRLFWRDLELHHPGIDSMRLPPEVAAAWKQRQHPDGRAADPAAGHRIRRAADSAHVSWPVRAFYLDIAQWAVEEPARWAPWAVPVPDPRGGLPRARNDARASPGWTSGPGNACPSCPPWSPRVERRTRPAPTG